MKRIVELTDEEIHFLVDGLHAAAWQWDERGPASDLEEMRKVKSLGDRLIEVYPAAGPAYWPGDLK